VNYHILKKKDLDEFIKKLSRKMKVVAPVDKGYNQFAFEEVSSAERIALQYIPTILPPKKYFMPQKEKILDFDISEKVPEDRAVIEYDKIAIFGIHTCDLAGIQCLNMVFNERPRDYNYLTRKDHIFSVGLECNDYCDEYASCALVNSHLPNGGYDLFLTDLGDRFICHVNTQQGADMADFTGLFPNASPRDLSDLDSLRESKRKIFKNEVDVDARQLPGLFEKAMESPVWSQVGAKCVSCGNCTNVCPTCYCFDMFDQINLDMKTGSRFRVWDSCQLEPFAKVAGGENFREERLERQRHRFYRKFKYPIEKYYRFFCTGCGRCTRTCMAKISLKETLNALAKESL
jgi:sulfhydrogenase subunit beta (sulfur reductase)